MDDKTKQVQVRFPEQLHRQLKSSLDLDGRKLVDFFNEAAKAYLADKIRYEKNISKIIDGIQDDSI